MSKPVIVTINSSCDHASGTARDDIEIDREEWDEMTPAERVAYLDESADTLAMNRFSWGWHIADADDMAATEGGA